MHSVSNKVEGKDWYPKLSSDLHTGVMAQTHPDAGTQMFMFVMEVTWRGQILMVLL